MLISPFVELYLDSVEMQDALYADVDEKSPTSLRVGLDSKNGSFSLFRATLY